MLSLEQFAAGKPPVIKCADERREYIMKIRRGPLEVCVLLTNVYTISIVLSFAGRAESGAALLCSSRKIGRDRR